MSSVALTAVPFDVTVAWEDNMNFDNTACACLFSIFARTATLVLEFTSLKELVPAAYRLLNGDIYTSCIRSTFIPVDIPVLSKYS